MRYTYFLLLIITAALLPCVSHAQELVMNGGFDNTTSNWTTDCTTVEASYYESTYGGSSTTNHVAEIDDESCFHQDVCVLPGMSYILALQASRRPIAASTVTTNITVQGLNASNTVVGTALVNVNFSRSNSSFAFSAVTGIPVITVPLTSGIVRLRIQFSDVTPGYSTLGMIVDNISLTFQNSPAYAGDTAGCVNTPVQLSVSNLPASGISYSWSMPGGTPATSTLPNPTASWSNTGTYLTTCILSNAVCPVDTVRRNVVISSLTPPVVVSPVHYCLGQTAAPLSATGNTLKWYTTATGGTASLTAPVPTTTTAGTTTWYVSSSNGSCESVRVPVTVTVHNKATAAFTYQVKYGCAQDTVLFNNLSSPGTYQWSFGDNTGSTQASPVHIYTMQANYTVKLENAIAYCPDSAIQQVDLRHPLQAAFTVARDSICQNSPVNFTNTSTATTHNNVPPQYSWDFGDGNTATTASPSHTYTQPGVFRVVLRVTDFVPCTDSMVKYIFVDSFAGFSLTVTDSVICRGKRVFLHTDYTQGGFRGISWNFGDDNQSYISSTSGHAYEQPGTYTITAIAHYRICPDITITKQVVVKPNPIVSLGRDTSICPGAAPLVLTNNNVEPGTTYRWYDGSTGQSISVTIPGTYWISADRDGCTSADSIEVLNSCYIDIPNVFTPNGDGINDYFFPRQLLSSNLSYFRMQVFNRWGEIIFKTDKTDGRGWDGSFNGKPQPAGVYVYLIEATVDGKNMERHQGNVTLLR